MSNTGGGLSRFAGGKPPASSPPGTAGDTNGDSHDDIAMHQDDNASWGGFVGTGDEASMGGFGMEFEEGGDFNEDDTSVYQPSFSFDGEDDATQEQPTKTRNITEKRAGGTGGILSLRRQVDKGNSDTSVPPRDADLPTVHREKDERVTKPARGPPGAGFAMTGNGTSWTEGSQQDSERIIPTGHLRLNTKAVITPHKSTGMREMHIATSHQTPASETVPMDIDGAPAPRENDPPNSEPASAEKQQGVEQEQDHVNSSAGTPQSKGGAPTNGATLVTPAARKMDNSPTPDTEMNEDTQYSDRGTHFELNTNEDMTTNDGIEAADGQQEESFEELYEKFITDIRDTLDLQRTNQERILNFDVEFETGYAEMLRAHVKVLELTRSVHALQVTAEEMLAEPDKVN